MLRAGTLNRRIRIEKQVTALDDGGQTLLDDAGQPVFAWVMHLPLWANILVKTGKQFMASSAETSTADASVRIRYRTDVVADMRVVVGASVDRDSVDYSDATIYEILAILPDEARREHVDLVCRTGANQG